MKRLGLRLAGVLAGHPDARAGPFRAYHGRDSEYDEKEVVVLCDECAWREEIVP